MKIQVQQSKLISLLVKPAGPTLDIMIPDFNIIVIRLKKYHATRKISQHATEHQKSQWLTCTANVLASFYYLWYISWATKHKWQRSEMGWKFASLYIFSKLIDGQFSSSTVFVVMSCTHILRKKRTTNHIYLNQLIK